MKKLLIVEDDAAILEVVQMILAEEGYDVRSTSLSNNVLDMALDYKPDLIILDFLLAGQNGAVICQTLKADTDTAHIPIIIFSAHPLAEALIKECGADNFISKPFDLGEFLKAVKNYIR